MHILLLYRVISCIPVDLSTLFTRSLAFWGLLNFTSIFLYLVNMPKEKAREITTGKFSMLGFLSQYLLEQTHVRKLRETIPIQPPAGE